MHVLGQAIFDDRAASYLCVTERFFSSVEGRFGVGHRIDYLVADLLRIADGKIVEGWHAEDFLSRHLQLV